jgi:putative DNA primase/helicase
MQQDHYHKGAAQTSDPCLDFNNVAIASDDSRREQHRRLDDQARDELRRRAAEIVQAFLGEPNPKLCKWNSRQWRWGRKGSFALNVWGDEAGLWFDHENEIGGDIIDFLQYQLGCSTADAIANALDYLGPASPQSSCAAAQREPEPDDAIRIARALRIWSEVVPLCGSLAEVYLNKRGIYVPDEALSVLGLHRHCPFEKRRAPALVALIEDIVTSEPVAIQRRELTQAATAAGSGMSYGPKSGGAIKLVPLTTAGELAIGEGIETALSGMQLGYGPAWSVLDAGGVSSFPVLEYIHRLTILVDHDASKINEAGSEVGLAGQRAAATCCERWLAAGKSVRLVTPDVVGHDMNDVLLKSSSVTVLTRSP